MNSKMLKLSVVGAFSLFGVCAFFFWQPRTEAQSKIKKPDEILSAIAGYKTWKQVDKRAGERTPLEMTTFALTG